MFIKFQFECSDVSYCRYRLFGCSVSCCDIVGGTHRYVALIVEFLCYGDNNPIIIFVDGKVV